MSSSKSKSSKPESSKPESRPIKRQRTFGAPTEDDAPSRQFEPKEFNDDRISTRVVTSPGVPTLTTLCARVFVKNIQRLSSDPRMWDPTREWLKLIPDALINKLFAMLRASCPNILSHGFIIAVGPFIPRADRGYYIVAAALSQRVVCNPY